MVSTKVSFPPAPTSSSPNQTTVSPSRLYKPNIFDYLSSPIVQFTVGQGSESKVFQLHQALLELESQRIATGLKLCHVEGKERTYGLKKEDPELFKYFAEFLYRDTLVFQNAGKALCTPSILVKAARLYTLGERLLAPGFKDAALQKFSACLSVSLPYFTTKTKPDPKDVICDLLEISLNELPDSKSTKDPLRALILALAIQHLEDLQKRERFENLLSTHIDFCRDVAMKAGRRNMLVTTWQGTLEML